MLAVWLVCCVVFLCLHVFTARQWVVGVGACFWVGHKKLYERAHCRVHVQHRVSVRRLVGGGCLRSQPEGFSFGCGLCVVGCL